MPDSRTMVSQPEVARVFGHLPAAFLQRVFFLQVKFGGPHGIRVPVTALAKYLGCTDRHLWRIIRQLENLGVLDVKQPDGPGSISTFQVQVAAVRSRCGDEYPEDGRTTCPPD